MNNELIYHRWVLEYFEKLQQYIHDNIGKGTTQSFDYVFPMVHAGASSIWSWYSRSDRQMFLKCVDYLHLIGKYGQEIDEVELGKNMGIDKYMVDVLRCMQWG